MRLSYGNTWWGKQWLNALKNIDFSNRLPRGRSYAKKGAVLSIDIQENSIYAKVQGSRSQPYTVEFTIPAFDLKERNRILRVIMENPLLLSHLLNRELPTALKEACDNENIQLFPNSWNDIQGDCTCPDWAVPCKHMAAVLYLIANEIDKNPFIIFELKRFDLFKALENIGYITSENQKTDILKLADLYQADSPPIKEGNIVPTKTIDLTKISDNREPFLKILTDHPIFFQGGDFKKLLRKVYKSLAKNLKNKDNTTEELLTTDIMESVEHLKLLVDEKIELANCQLIDHHNQIIQSFQNLHELEKWLEQVPINEVHKLSTTLQFLVWLRLYSKKLASTANCIPQLIQLPTNQYKIRWVPALLNPYVEELVEHLGQIKPAGILQYQIMGHPKWPVEKDEVLAIMTLFLNYWVTKNNGLNYKEMIDIVPQLFFNGLDMSFTDFKNQATPDLIHLWLNRFYLGKKEYAPIIQIDDLDNQFEVSLFIEDYSNNPPELISIEDLLGFEDYKSIRIKVLRDIAMLTEFFPNINQLLALRGKRKLLFDNEAFVEILFNIIPTLRLLGIQLLLPKSLKKILRPQVSLSIGSSGSGSVQKTWLSLNSLLSFQWKIALGDQILTQDAFIKLVNNYSGLVKVKDQYAYFDAKEVAKLIDKLENPPQLNGHQLLQVALSEDYHGAKIAISDKVKQLLHNLFETKSINPPGSLQATLRPYQHNGYNWLLKNTQIGFGSLIADDMGLGKTLQIITLLLQLKEEKQLDQSKALIIVPTTLLTNWEKEIQKFAPSLTPLIYHGSGRSMDNLDQSDLLITSYGVARSEAKQLNKKDWRLVIIDEAQNIKNPKTAQTKAIKSIKAPIKIAMSGTPVENRLSEYWSIFDFINSGYLDTLKKFKTQFASPIEKDRDQVSLNRFRKITAPFILRRLKTDKTIIKDLPEKIEQDQFCQLTPEQTAIYQNVVDTIMQEIVESEGIQRRGLVLKLITALKQVCNHPKHFLKKGKTSPELSGKSLLLMNLVPQLINNNEKILIFTQYREMGKLLAQMLKQSLNLEVPFLHGGVSRKARDKMVEDFQTNRLTKILLLSLKAGGTGLNLTAANNVFHYDLWWNPAVEAQATDRAFRIGQQKNVMVHRFITKGTFEEKINDMIQSKKELANLTVSVGEKWIGEFSNQELKELIKLEQNI